MPYVEVWVDYEPCDGTCDDAKEAKRLQAIIDEAERHLRTGDADAALHVLTNDPILCMKSPSQMASEYEAWKQGRLAGFEPPQMPGRAG